MPYSTFINNILSCAGINVDCTQQEDLSKSEDASVLRTAVASSSKSYLLGEGKLNQAEVSQWISFVFAPIDTERLAKLDCLMTVKSYLVGSGVTIADFAVCTALSDKFDELKVKSYPAVSRWYSHIQNISSCQTLFKQDFCNTPTLIPVMTLASISGTDKVTPTAAVPSTNPDASTTKVGSSSSGNEDSAKVEKGDKKAKDQPNPTSVATASLDPSKLDIRCGKIVKCWNHPESEKLLCEEIDLGEGKTRTIASGLRAFYSAEQVEGRKVLVLANLKERNMAGFKSQGMVLCAVAGEHSDVKLLEAPASADIGARVQFPGYSNGDAATPAQMAKKKILEGLAPFLRTDLKGVAHWDKSPFTIGDDVCCASLCEASIS